MQAWSPQASSEGPCRGRLMGYPQGREERNGTTTPKTRVHSWCALNVGLGPNFSPSGLRRVRQRGVERDRGLRSQLWVGTWDAQDITGLAHFDAGVGGPGRLMSTVENPYAQLDPQASSGHPKRSRGERSVILTGGRCGPAFGRKQWASAGPRAPMELQRSNGHGRLKPAEGGPCARFSICTQELRRP